MAVSGAALLALTAAAAAKPDPFQGKSEGHGKENHSVFNGDTHNVDFRSDSHHAYGRKKDDHHPHGDEDGHSGHFTFEPQEHEPYQAPDQIEAFQHFWRDTGSFAHSCVQSAWSSIASYWDDHEKTDHKPHGGYTPASYGGADHDKPGWNADWDKPDHHGGPDWDKHDKPDQTAWDKPGWGKPHNHDRPDKPGWHVPGPDCHEQSPIELPEPSSLPVLGSALLAAWLFRRRNKALRAD